MILMNSYSNYYDYANLKLPKLISGYYQSCQNPSKMLFGLKIN